jgi:hypothetical protein
LEVNLLIPPVRTVELENNSDVLPCFIFP